MSRFWSRSHHNGGGAWVVISGFDLQYAELTRETSGYRLNKNHVRICHSEVQETVNASGRTDDYVCSYNIGATVIKK